MQEHCKDPELGRLLGVGKEAEVFEYGARAVKLYKSELSKRAAFREAAILAIVESLDLPAPAVHGVLRIGGRWGVIMDRAFGPSFADAADSERDRQALLRAMARLHGRVHAKAGTQLSNLKTRLAANIGKAQQLDQTRRRELLSGLVGMPDGDRLCHGDFHLMNILGPIGKETIVDWLDASQGDPAADVCRSFVLIEPRSAALAYGYVDAYAEISGVSREDILRWRPFVAATRLAEGVPDEVEGLMRMVGPSSAL